MEAHNRPSRTRRHVRFTAPSILELLAGNLQWRGRGRGLPQPAGAARLRCEYPAVLLLAGRVGPADAQRRAPADDPEGERSVASRDRPPAARASQAPEGSSLG